MKKILALVACLSLAASLAIGGSIAYLQDTDQTVNVMTLGNVKIDQIEQERDASGKLVDYTQFKSLYPAVFEGNYIPWADSADWVTPNDEAWKVVADNANVIDKFVTVKNTGKSEAYVRTIIAYEGDTTYGPNGAYIHVVHNTNNVDPEIGSEDVGVVRINEVDYTVFVYTYPEALAAGATTIPSLKQVYMNKAADNDVVAKYGDTYDILVVSQAMQTAGFENAAAALDAGFGDVTAANVIQWMKDLKKPESGDQPQAKPDNQKVEFNGEEYNDIYEALAAANANGGGKITLLGSFSMDKTADITSNITIEGDGAQITRKTGFTGTLFTVKAGATLTTDNLILNGEGETATGNLIKTEGNGSIVLNAGTVLKNNHGAHAVYLDHGSKKGTLTLTGAQIINNSSDSGAIWGGGQITINEGSKINNNSSTGSAGAIRMVSKCNLTMNGGEICNNTAAADGGVIWGYGDSTYHFNGGKMSGNTAGGTGGAIYTGKNSVINISGNFELCDNSAANSGAIRLTDHTSMTMTGGKVSGNKQNGESNAFNTWNNTISITGGELADNMSFVGGLGLTIGAANIDGVISYNLSTNHNTAYLAANFNSFKFTVDEAAANFANFNFKPAAGYTYTAGDEAKLVCMNEGYETYWDAATSTFRLQSK